MRKSARITIAAAIPLLALAACKKSNGDTAPTNTAAPAAVSGPAGPAPTGGWAEQVVATADGGYLMGNPDAKVKLVEYGSRTCPHCGHFAEEAMPELKSKYITTGKLSYEFRDYAIHAPDIAAILLGRCNGASTFFPILEAMFADQKNTLPKLDTLPDGFAQGLQGKTANQQAQAWADFLGYQAFVGQRGVPEAKAKACLADPAAIDALGKQMQDGSTKYNITGTPTFIINGDVVGTADWVDLKPKLDAAIG